MVTRTKRILFVENGIGYGGAVICMRHLVRALNRDKYEPIVVTGRSGGPYAGLADDATWLSISDRRIDISTLRRTLERYRWPDQIPALRAILLQLLARLDDVANFVPFFLQFVWTILRLHPDIVHTNNEPLCNRAALIAAKLLRIPVVAHVRGDQSGSRSMKWLFRLPDHFIPVSRWIAESIARVGVPTRQSTLIYDGIDFERLDRNADGTAFRAAHGIPRDAFAVGLPGILIAWKGQKLFLEAAKALAAEFPDMFFVIVGGTPEECRPFEQELHEFVAQTGLQDRVVFTGHIADMSATYNGLDIVVSASTAQEPLGIVVVEAMIMGRPVVAPRHGGAMEIVENERTGLLFAPNDAGALVDAIRRFRNDAAFRDAVAVSGRAQILETFSIIRNARQVEEVYRALLEGPSG